MLRPLRFLLFALLIALVACSTNAAPPTPQETGFIGPIAPTATSRPVPRNAESDPIITPEPKPTDGPAFTMYKIKQGDTLIGIAAQFDVNQDDIMTLNGLTDPNVLNVGDTVKIPVAVDRVGSDLKLIPDSEFVYGPAYVKFDVNAFAQKYGGYLVNYQERVEGTVMTGPQIIQLVAERFSVGPRILLSILQYQGGWVTSNSLTATQVEFPMGLTEWSHPGLYKQAFYISSYLNAGYYGKLTGQLTALQFTDTRRAKLAPSINPGTAAIQSAFAHEANWDNWQKMVGPDGWIATYRQLFGDPFANAMDPVVPPDLKQPQMRLPFEDGRLWYFTGGPHAGWADGSAWAAVDFKPKDQAGSCWTSADWTIAAAPGRIIQAENGRVVENLAGTDFQGNGWSLLYMHQASDGRVEIGTNLKMGDHIGHPSCEGGAAETSHLHFARLYNGQWIPAADPKVPLVLSGWLFHGAQQEYDGTMTRGSDVREAADAQVPDQNGVTADGGQ